jgi:hypothetical protein
MDLFHVRRNDDKPQTDPLPRALLALPRHNVRDLEDALLGGAKGLGALKRTGPWMPTQAALRPHNQRLGASAPPPIVGLLDQLQLTADLPTGVSG